MPSNSILDELGVAQSQLSDELNEVETDITLLRQFTGTREEHQQFSDSIRGQQRAVERVLEQLALDAEDCDDAKQQAELAAFITQTEARVKALQRSFRSALLQYQANAASTAKKERELLLSGAATPAELRKRKARTGNAVLNAASDVTTALQETVSMMNEEIEKSVKNITALQDSSEKLKKTKEQHITLDAVMKTSRNLIKSLEQADAMDRWLMLGGMLLFSLVVFNILRKRIWIPGLSTLFALIRYLVLGGGREKAGALTSPVLESVVSPLVLATASPLVASLVPTTTIAAAVASGLMSDAEISNSSTPTNSTATTIGNALPTYTIDTLSSTASVEALPDPAAPVDETSAENTSIAAVLSSSEHPDSSTSEYQENQEEEQQQQQEQQQEEQQQGEQPQQEHPQIHVPINFPNRRRLYTMPVEKPVHEEL